MSKPQSKRFAIIQSYQRCTAHADQGERCELALGHKAWHEAPLAANAEHRVRWNYDAGPPKPEVRLYLDGALADDTGPVGDDGLDGAA